MLAPGVVPTQQLRLFTCVLDDPSSTRCQSHRPIGARTTAKLLEQFLSDDLGRRPETFQDFPADSDASGSIDDPQQQVLRGQMVVAEAPRFFLRTDKDTLGQL